MPRHWTAEDRSAALWVLLIKEVDRLDRQGQHPKWRAAIRAALRVPEEAYRGPEHDTLGSRLKSAKSNGAFGDPGKASEGLLRTWWGYGVWRLGLAVDRRLVELDAEPEGWQTYLTDDATLGRAVASSTPADAQPVFVDRVIATYRMKGRAVNAALTERSVTAQREGVEDYVVRAYSPISGQDLVQVTAVLNCRAGPLRFLPDGLGGEIHEVSMRFPEPLPTGGRHFFASQVTSQRNEQPIVEMQVTSHGIAAGGLTMRIQFEEDHHPVAAWWFAETIEALRLHKPPDGDPRRLTWNAFGYLEHTFAEPCKSMAKYGIAWEWPEALKRTQVHNGLVVDLEGEAMSGTGGN